MTSARMFVLPFALLVVSCLKACSAQTVTWAYGPTFGQYNAALFTINVDDWYSFYWNGQFINTTKTTGWPNTTTYTLIPVNQCNYPNVLAIAAMGDRLVDDGLIMEVTYGSTLYQSGVSSQIKVAVGTSVTDPQWYSDTTTSSVWASSSSQPTCNMVAEEMTIPNTAYYTKGTRWVWYGSCTALQYASVYFKLVIPTICNGCN